MRKYFRLRQLLIYVGVLVTIFCLTGFVITLSAKKYLEKTVEIIQMNLMKSVEPYEKILRNASWPAQRYEIILNNRKNFNPDVFSIIEAQMLQLSFGFDYEYFLLRSFGGKTRVEIKRGSLLHQKDPISIWGEKNFRNQQMGFLIRTCEVANVQYLCLIDIPPQREFVPIEERNYSVIALPVTEILMNAKNVFYSQWFLPAPILQIDLNKNIFDLSDHVTQKATLLNIAQKIDEGFYIQGSYSAWDLSLRIFLFFSVIIIFSALLLISGSHYVKRRIQFKLNYTLLNKKLEHYNQIQGLIRGVVHDIKSPLAALKTLTGFEQDHQKQTLMNHVVKRLQMIARDLEIKRKTVEEHDLSTLPLGLLLQIVHLEKTKEYETQIQLVYAPSKDECWIYGSYSEFFRMMSNLINNAVEASPDGTPIIFGYRILENQLVEIYVKDQGKGIPAEHLQRVFERGASFGKKEGTGFGLFHCKSVVESMRGRVAVESKVNVGTTINMVLPIVKKPSWAVEKLSLQGITKVLVIDDEIMYHELWKKKINGRVELLCYEHPSKVPQSLLGRADTITLLDNNFGAEYGLGFRFLEENAIANCIVVTAEWTLSDIQKAVEKLSVKLCGKDYLDQLRIFP